MQQLRNLFFTTEKQKVLVALERPEAGVGLNIAHGYSGGRSLFDSGDKIDEFAFLERA